MPVVIENPILNSPFKRPGRYFRFDEDGISDEIVEGRRPSSYFIPIAAPKLSDASILNKLAEALSAAGTKLPRQACKMATGSGKTVVMAMIIAWQSLNKHRNPTDRRFSDAFLAVAPGITIRDRLRVILPSDPNN